MRFLQQNVWLSRLLQGWLFTLLALALLSFFPQLESYTYDELMFQYRYVPRQVYLFDRGYHGLHRSITLVGDPGVGNRDPIKEPLKAIGRLRQDQAAATCWITDARVKLADSLRNQPGEKHLVYVLPAQTHWNVKVGDQPPLVFKATPSDGVIREVYLALKTQAGLTPCLPLALYARYLGLPECKPQQQGDRLNLGSQSLPVSEDDLGLALPLMSYPSSVRAHSELQGESVTTVADPMEPIRLNDVMDMPNYYFGKRVRERFYFLGTYAMTGVGEHVTPLGPFRDFQVAALALDTLIQGPHLRLLHGPALWLYYGCVSSLLALWLLRPASLLRRWVRLVQLYAVWYVAGLSLFALGVYPPMAWLVFYSGLLTAWMMARIWLTTMGYVRRYGGTTAERMLALGQTRLDHAVAEERVATIVFVGLPGHLRQQELEDHPMLLEHRQIFSAQVARITHRFDGIVHDFQADYLMLGFGTHPGRPDEDHARKGFRAAQELVASQEFFREAWQPVLVERGERVQVSVNTGLVAVGWVGTSKFKRASAAIGDTTNVAARLLGTAKKLDLDVVVSESAHELIHDQAEFAPLPPVMLKGKTEAVAIYKWVHAE